MTDRKRKMNKQSKNDQSRVERNAKKVATGTASVLLSTGLMMGSNARSVKAGSRPEDEIVQVVDRSEESPQEVIKEFASEETAVATEAQDAAAEEVQVDTATEEAPADVAVEEVEVETQAASENVEETVSDDKENVNAEVIQVKAAQIEATGDSESGTEVESPVESADSGVKSEWTEQTDKFNDLSSQFDTKLNELKETKTEEDWKTKYQETQDLWKQLEDQLKSINDINVTEIDGTSGVSLDQWKENKDDLVKKISDFLSERNKKLEDYIKELDAMGLNDKDAIDPSTLKQDFLLEHQDPDNPKSSVSVDFNVVGDNAVEKLSESQYASTLGKDKYIFYLGGGADKYKDKEVLTITYTTEDETIWHYGNTIIKSIKIAFSNPENNTWSSSIIFGTDPTNGWWYSNMSGITAKMTFYDKDGKQVTFEQNAYVTISSLNSYGPSKGNTYNSQNHEEDLGYEGAELKVDKENGTDGDSIKILESTIKPEDENSKIIHATPGSNNSEIFNNEMAGANNKYAGWDVRDSKTGIYGAGVFWISGNSITLRSFKANSDGTPFERVRDENGKPLGKEGNSQSAWFVWTTKVPKLTIDTENPDEDKLNVDWKNYFIPSAVVHYVDEETGKDVDISSILTGEPGKTIDYSSSEVLKKLEEQGYEVVSNEYDSEGKSPEFAQNDGTVHYKIVLKKKAAPVDPKPDPEPTDPINPQPDPEPTPAPDTPQPDQPTDPQPTTPAAPAPDNETTDSEDPDKSEPSDESIYDKNVHSNSETENLKADKETVEINPQNDSVSGVVNSTQKENLNEVSSMKSDEENTLPQTGAENDSVREMLSALISALGLGGIAGTRKRKKKNNKK